MKKKEEKMKEVKKAKKTKKEKKGESFGKSLKKEISLIKWPEGKDLVKYTIATIVLCIILILFFQFLDVILAYIKEFFN